MGNQQQQQRSVTHHYIDLDRPEAIYLPNDIVSGSVSNLKNRKSFILLTGIIHFKKTKKKHLENCEITFFSTKFPLISSSTTKQNFQLHLNEHLPPSFNNLNILPNISYSINLVYEKSKSRIYSSIPIRVCPLVQIDQPLLLTPLLFGPIENLNFHTKLNIKANRSVFQFGDVIQIYYELQNPHEEYIRNIEVSLGIYYLVESNVYQEDISNSIENLKNISSNQKLIRNKVLLNIPNKIYLPPTFKYKYDQKDDQSLFHLTIDYKIQFKIYLGNPENLWQVDVPIILCNTLLGQTDKEIEDVIQNSDTN
jgi:hypothetical protein